jgi:DNA-binding transcriptional regulator LsrR (DeoR family)
MISMILSEAKEVGIVDIHIRNPLLNNVELANQIKASFALKDCYVIPTAIQDTNTLRRLVAQRTTDVFNLLLTDQKTVGITWGRTCYEFITAYSLNHNFKDLSVVALIGGSNQTAGYFQLNEMVRLFAEKLNGVAYFIHGPALASSGAEKELYLKSAAMQTILEKWQNIDIIISGIGTPPNFDVDERETYIGEHEVYKQLQDKAIGDICAHYYNIKGEFVQDAFSERIIGIPVKDLKRSKTVIGIAADPQKNYSVLGALRTGIIDILVTDEQTAKAIIKATNLS